MKNRLVRIVLSKWYLLVGIILFTLLVMPANSPLGIPGNLKVFIALPIVLILFWTFMAIGKRGKNTKK